MASLIEELIDVLESEEKEYGLMINIAEKKTPIIIKGDLLELQKITEEEQMHTEKLASLEKKRMEIVGDIGLVLNKKPEELTIKNIITLLDGQEKEQKRLSRIHDELKITLKNIAFINDHNKNLIDQSLEMIQFNMNMYMSMNSGPETANYNNKAGNVYGGYTNTNKFDTKQ